MLIFASPSGVVYGDDTPMYLGYSSRQACFYITHLLRWVHKTDNAALDILPWVLWWKRIKRIYSIGKALRHLTECLFFYFTTTEEEMLL